ncbi:MAG: quinolinate synthase NadA [Candidatus Cloacimonetes bacterium]|nr:quinolinate synthase NadA [Candidatus Cloacimonadota bacterium]
MTFNKSITELICQIENLKKKKNVLILVHNYQPLEIHSVADITGDSLQLAQEAAMTDAKIIVLAGVKFMAETAKLLNPKAKVLLSHPNAGCPMADMITAEQLRDFKAEFPGSEVVCYVNSSIEVKAESDICCTSSNALKVVKSIPPDKKILFVPDQNLGSYVAEQSGREIIVWKGFCSVHHVNITVQDVERVRREYPDYTLMVHPECIPEVVRLADIVASTKGMADFVAKNDKVILGTEIGLTEQLRSRYPAKKIHPLSEKAICKNMKKSSLPLLLEVIDKEANEITIEKQVADRAMQALKRMLEVS